MTYWQSFILESSDRGTWPLAALLIICVALRRLLPENEKKRLRMLVVSFLGHLVLVALAAKDPQGANVRFYRLGAFIFAATGYVGVFNFIVFSMFLSRLQVGVHMVLRDVVGVVFTVIAVLAVSPSLGFDWRGVLATSAGLVAVIGLALQETVANIIGRVALQLDKSITIGDWISVDGYYGQVTDMRWRYATIETNNYETVIIPNGQLLKAKFTVHGRRNGQRSAWRRWVYFHVDTRTPPADVMRLVGEALVTEPMPHVASHPAAHAILMSLDHAVARYAVRYWITDPAFDDATDSVVRTRVFYALRRANIEVAIPTQSVLLTEVDEKRLEAEAEADQRDRLRSLKRVELFRSLKGEELDSLARSMRRAPFAEGELLTRQGAEAHWLYIIVRGVVSVRVTVEGEEREVAKLREGDYLGEMGLMTGEPRTANVVALSNVDCFRLDKEAFRDLLEKRPELAEHVAEDLARRKTELEAVRENLDQAAKARRQAESKSHLVDRIRKFFSQ
jgi:small-conductance mechanosensitive channel/CRP-like cAMP-binding protein